MNHGKEADPLFSDLAGRRVFIETYGCRYNFGDTAKLKEILLHRNCSLVSSEADADAVIVNTCTVVAPTERRMLRRLSALRNHNLYVTGCMPLVQREAIMGVCTPKILPPAAIQDHYHAAGTVPPDPVAIVQIAQGCSGACTYCITRRARGTLKSAPAGEILNQISACALAGSVEIHLTAQDAGAWGRDLGMVLPDLLRAIGRLEGHFLVRLGMMNPATVIDILDDLVDAFCSEKLFRFIHVPVQSGSDPVLKKMGRGYRCEEFEQVIAAFRRRYPDITVATDMIVGFPGEEEDDFSASLDLLRRVRINKVNVTRFSRRPHTPAFSWKDSPDSTKKARSRRMQVCAEEIYHEIHARYLGCTLPCTVTEQVRKGSVMARTRNYLGIVITENLPIGFSGHVQVLKESGYFFTGRRIASQDESGNPYG